MATRSTNNFRHLCLAALIASPFAKADEASRLSVYQRCLLLQIETANEESAQSIKERCRKKEALTEEVSLSAVDRRIAAEELSLDLPFTLIPHKPNYLLPFTYNSKPNRSEEFDSQDLSHNTEVAFQISLKIPVAHRIFNTDWSLFAAYTGRSFWQAYNSDLSAPFRDTNHEPEIFLTQPVNWKLGSLNFRGVSWGINHQSNGRSVPLSRSWNRIYADFVFDYKNWAFSFKPWYRIPEDKKQAPDLADGDDNADIEKYLGHFELLGAYRWDDHAFSAMIRNNLRTDGYGAFQINWSFPISDHVNGYVYYFNGYGETMLDYNHNSNRIGLGFLLTDWL